MPAPVLQDLFYGPSLIKGREMFNHVLYREHCLGESRLQQLLSGQKMVYIQPPFMSTIKSHSFDSEYTKNIRLEFDSGTFLESNTNPVSPVSVPGEWKGVDKKNPQRMCIRSALAPANMDVLAEWMRNKSQHGGFYMNVFGRSVACRLHAWKPVQC